MPANAELIACSVLALLALLLLLRRRRSASSWLASAAGNRWSSTAALVILVIAVVVLTGVALPHSRGALAAAGVEPTLSGLLAGVFAACSVPIVWRAAILRRSGNPAWMHPFFRARPSQVALLATLSLLYLTAGRTAAPIAAAEQRADIGTTEPDHLLSVLGWLVPMSGLLALAVFLATVVPAVRWLLSLHASRQGRR